MKNISRVCFKVLKILNDFANKNTKSSSLGVRMNFESNKGPTIIISNFDNE